MGAKIAKKIFFDFFNSFIWIAQMGVLTRAKYLCFSTILLFGQKSDRRAQEVKTSKKRAELLDNCFVRAPWDLILVAYFFPSHTNIAVPQKRRCFVEYWGNQCVCPFICPSIIQSTTLGVVTDGRTDGRRVGLIPPVFYKTLPPLRPLLCYCKGYGQGKGTTDHPLPLGTWFLFIINIMLAGNLSRQSSLLELDVRDQSY